MLNLEAQCETLTKTLMVAPESPLLRAIWATAELVTDYCAHFVGDSDRSCEDVSNWLDWWRHCCEHGMLPMHAKAPNWKKPRKIKTLAQLAGLIYDCRKETK